MEKQRFFGILDTNLDQDNWVVVLLSAVVDVFSPI